MLTAILRSLRTGVVTIRYPDEPAAVPARFRGAPRIPAAGALSALAPSAVCPSSAITGEPGDPAYAIDLGRCVFCGRCADACTPRGAIELGRQIELAVRKRDRLIVRVEPSAPQARPKADEIAENIRRTLGRSLALRHLDSGSCNACDWELTALLNPVYDVRRLGIDFVASPRHADAVIVTGPVTRNLETAVRRTYEAMPDPKLVIAIGACACSGGIVGKSYASAGGVGEILPVDVLVPGCPPRPEAIIFGLLLGIGRLTERPR